MATELRTEWIPLHRVEPACLVFLMYVQPSPNGRPPPTAILLEAAHPEQDPEGLISKFLRNEVIRSGRKDLKAKLSGTKKDRLDVLLWYISDYSLRWGRSLSVHSRRPSSNSLTIHCPFQNFPQV